MLFLHLQNLNFFLKILDDILLRHLSTTMGYIFSDEAETGLDQGTRQMFADYLNGFPGIVLVASHDREFLKLLRIYHTLALPAKEA
jgi:DNA repair exonuclease SbcCD ATPase subunit